MAQREHTANIQVRLRGGIAYASLGLGGRGRDGDGIGGQPEDDASNAHPTLRRNSGPGSLAEVYEAHSAFVWRVVRRLGVPSESVEDVMHEVFIVAHRRLADYDGRAAITTWLYHLSRGVVSNWRRGRRREAARLSLVEEPRNTAPNPEHASQREEAAEFVRKFLASLDEDKRLVFELSEIDGLGMSEVAEIADIKLNTAYSRLRAARREFQRAVSRLQAQQVRGAG